MIAQRVCRSSSGKASWATDSSVSSMAWGDVVVGGGGVGGEQALINRLALINGGGAGGTRECDENQEANERDEFLHRTVYRFVRCSKTILDNGYVNN